ncbi:hypothetical protein GmRootV512_29640 [Variovorax sp. V512]
MGAPGCQGFPARLSRVVQVDGVRAFARGAGLSEGVVRKYLNGESFPTLDRLEKIAGTAGVSLGWLATGEGFPVQGITFDETEARIEGLSRWISLHVLALNIGLVMHNPEFAPHQGRVVPYVLTDVPFGEFIARMFAELEARQIWDDDSKKDKFLHDEVQNRLIALYQDCLNGTPPPLPRWVFAMSSTSEKA